MAGIINSVAPQPAATSDSGAQTAIADPILKKTKQSVEAKISPQLRKTFLAIENSGLELLSAGTMPQMVLKKLQSSPDVVGVVSDGVANVIATVFNSITKQMPPQQQQQFGATFLPAAGPASVALMCQVLDIAKEKLGLQITQDLVAKCTQATTQKVLAKFKVNNQQIQQVVEAGRQQGGAQAGQGAQ